MKSVFYLMDKYPYNQAIKDEIYSLFYYFSLNCIAHKEQEIKTILYDNYWSKKEQRAFLRRKRKVYYLIIAAFMQSPFIGSLMAKVYLFLLVIWRKCCQ